MTFPPCLDDQRSLHMCIAATRPALCLLNLSFLPLVRSVRLVHLPSRVDSLGGNLVKYCLVKLCSMFLFKIKSFRDNISTKFSTKC